MEPKVVVEGPIQKATMADLQAKYNLAARIRNVIGEVESTDDEKDVKDDANDDCDDLVKRIDELLNVNDDNDEDPDVLIKQERVIKAKDDLKWAMDEATSFETEMNTFSESISPSPLKDELEVSKDICSKLAKRRRDLEISIKSKCKEVETLNKDRTMPKDDRKELKAETLKVLEYNNNLSEALHKLQHKVSKLYDDKVEGIFSVLKEKVKDIDNWLIEKKSECENWTVDYGTCSQLEEVDLKSRQMTKEIAEKWKKFELLASEWNAGLCNEVYNKRYVDVLDEVRKNFGTLNNIVNVFKLLVNDMLHQKKEEEELVATIAGWKEYIADQEVNLRLLSDDPDIFYEQLDAFLKGLNEKSYSVKKFLEESNELLEKNRYDENGIANIEKDIVEFNEQWNGLKEEALLLREVFRTNVEKEEKYIADRYAVLGEELNEIDTWITDIMIKYDNKIVKYESCTNMSENYGKEIDYENIGLTRSIEDYWSKFKVISEEWSTSLRDKRNDESFADNMENIRNKFTALNDIAKKLKTLVEDMSLRRKSKEEICAIIAGWKLYVEDKELNLQAVSADPRKFHVEIELILNDINEKEADVKHFLEVANETIQNNKFDENEVTDIKDKIVDFWREWHTLKVEMEKIKEINDMFTIWLGKVNSIDVWLTDLTKEYTDYEIKYESYDQLKDVKTLIKRLLKDIAETWKKFEVLAKEWNTNLCEPIDDSYADILDTIKTKFKTLNEVASNIKALVKEMLYQKKAEDDATEELHSWIEYANTLEAKLRAVFGERTKSEQRINAVLAEINDKDDPVKTFLADSSQMLTKNEYDERTVVKIKEEIVNFRNKWNGLKCIIVQGQKDIENTIVDCLRIWQNIFNEYKLRVDGCEVGEILNIPVLENTIKKLGVLIERIKSRDGDLEEFNINSKSLIKVLQHENSTNVESQLESFFQQWISLEEKSESIQSKLKEHHDKLLEKEENLMKEWVAKHTSTKDWLDITSAELEIFTALDVELDDAERYLGELEVFENKVTSEQIFVEKGIEYGTMLVEGNQLLIEKNRESVLSDANDLRVKKANLLRNILSMKMKLVELCDKCRRVRETEADINSRLETWNRKLHDNNDVLEKYDKNGESSISNTQKCIDILLTLISELTAEKDDIKAFETTTRDLTIDFPHDRAETLNIGVKVFSDGWSRCKESATARLAKMKMKLHHLLKLEDCAINEWKENALKVISDVKDADRKLSSFGKCPSNIKDMMTFASKYEILYRLVIEIEDLVVKEKNNGNNSVECEKIQLPINVNTVYDDISTFDEEISLLKENMFVTKELIETQSQEIILKLLNDSEKSYNQHVIELENINFKENTQVQVFAACIQELKSLIGVIMKQEENIREVISSTETIDQDGFKLNSQLETLLKEWANSEQRSKSLTSKLKSHYIRLIEDEENLMEEWKFKYESNDEWLDSITNEIQGFTVPIADVDDFENYLAILNKLVSKVNTRKKMVEESIEHGEHLSEGDELIYNKNRLIIKNDIQTTKEKKTTLLECLLLAKKKLMELRERRRLLRSNESEIVTSMVVWQYNLNESNDILEQCEVTETSTISETLKCIDTLTDLLKRMNSKDHELTTFVTTVRALMIPLPEEKSSSFNMDVNLLTDGWSHCKEKTNKLLNVVKLKMDEFQKYEGYSINEWKSNALKIIFRLDEIEKELSCFREDADNIKNLMVFVSRYEALYHRIIDTDDSIVKQKDIGSGLLSSKNVHLSEYVKIIQTDVATFDDKLSLLLQKMLDLKELLENEANKRVLENINRCEETYKEYILKLDGCYIGKNSQSQNLATLINKLEVLTDEIKTQIESMNNTTNVISDGDGGKHSYLRLQPFFQQVVDLEERSESILSRLSYQYDKLIEAEERLMVDWTAKQTATNEWLNSITKEIEVFTSLDAEVDVIEVQLERFSTLERKIDDEKILVDDNIEHGTHIAKNDQLLFNDNRVSIIDDIDAFRIQKANLNEKLLLAKRTMMELRKKKRLVKESEDDVITSLSRWQDRLQYNIDAVDRCEVDDTLSISDTQNSIDVLTLIRDGINSDQDKFRSFETSAWKLVKALFGKKADDLKTDLQLLFKDWDDCKEKVSERLAVLTLKMNQLQKYEDCAMNEWNTHAFDIISQLETVDNELYPCSTGSVNIKDVISFITKYEDFTLMITKVKDAIAKQKEISVDLVESRNVQLPENLNKIQTDCLLFDERLAELLKNMSTTKNKIEDEARENVQKNLEDCKAWLSAVQDRCPENVGIGRDLETVQKKIEELKLTQVQAISYVGILDSQTLLEYLTDDRKNELRAINEQLSINNIRIRNHLKVLENVENLWREFDEHDTELSKFLHDVGKVLTPSTGLDWTQTINFKASCVSFENVRASMESRLHLVDKLKELADQLVEFHQTGSNAEKDSLHMIDKCQLRVKEITNLWNFRFKQSAALITLLCESRNKYKALEKKSREVHTWITEVNEALDKLTVDITNKHYEELRTLIKEKQEERNNIEELINEINKIESDLSGDIVAEYSIEGQVITDNYVCVELDGIKELHHDFDVVCVDLDEFQRFRGKSRMIARRLPGSTRRFFLSID